MDHTSRYCLNRYFLTPGTLILVILPLLTLFARPASGQGYEVGVRPDLWYNDVDGIQVGSIFAGRVAGTHEEGPHRLDAGFWISTWFPSLPVSYSLQFTEPVSAWSDYGSEFSIQLATAVREGYHAHGVTASKRWQDPFEYLNYWEAGAGYQFEKRFDDEYAVFPELWSDSWKGLIQPWLSRQQRGRLGMFNFTLSAMMNTLESPFQAASISVSQQVVLSGQWQLRLRAFGAVNSRDALPEYQQQLATGAEINTLGSRISRAKGSVPTPWVRSGHVHFSGGPNLRGFRESDVEAIMEGSPRFFNRVAAYNVEFDLPNPLQTVIRRSQLQEFLSFRSYLFTDGAVAEGEAEIPGDSFYADAGAGLTLSLNIPDYQGRPRGFVIRYEVPFWLSDPINGDSLSFRHLLGFGATITF